MREPVFLTKDGETFVYSAKILGREFLFKSDIEAHEDAEKAFKRHAKLMGEKMEFQVLIEEIL